MNIFKIQICDDCFNLAKGTCNEPECIFCRKTREEVSSYLDNLLIRPIIDGIQLGMADNQKDYKI